MRKLSSKLKLYILQLIFWEAMSEFSIYTLFFFLRSLRFAFVQYAAAINVTTRRIRNLS